MIFVLLSRLFMMYAIPLNDTTEARYGEMARKMFVTHDWVTLWHDVGVPFWGKPPLAVWLATLSMQLFGVNAFAVRFPAFLASVGLLGVTYFFIKRYRSMLVADTSVLVLLSSFIFYLSMGTMMMDPILLVGVVLSQCAFWDAMHRDSKVSGYLFFIGIAIGLLAKGPLILVLLAGSLGSWLTLTRRWKACWHVLPFFSGSLLVLLIVLPWYILAEIKTPGFLEYFIIGEHFGRFLSSSWQGDKYGFAHAQKFGMIWVYLILSLIPWVTVLPIFFLKNKARAISIVLREDILWSSWKNYWLCCFFFPCLFFTFSSNIIYPYTLPSAPAFAILFSEAWVIYGFRRWQLLRLVMLVGVVGFVSGLLFLYYPTLVSKSEDKIIQLWNQQEAIHVNPLIYLNRHSFSASFYSAGHVVYLKDLASLCDRVNCQDPVYVVIQPHLLSSFPRPYEKIGTIRQSTLLKLSSRGAKIL